MYTVKILNLDLLKQHELIDSNHLRELTEQIESDGYISDPIIVDQKTLIILDGHHRFNAAKKLRLKSIPVCLVDYQDCNILVDCWRKGEKITKEDVIRAGTTGKLLAPKTSKHTIPDRPINKRIQLSLLK